MSGHLPRLKTRPLSLASQDRPPARSPSARDDGQERIPTARSRPFTEFLHETDAITDGNQNHFHARIGCDHLIEGADRCGVLVVSTTAYVVATLSPAGNS